MILEGTEAEIGVKHRGGATCERHQASPWLVIPEALQQGKLAGGSLLGPVVVHRPDCEGGVAVRKILHGPRWNVSWHPMVALSTLVVFTSRNLAPLDPGDGRPVDHVPTCLLNLKPFACTTLSFTAVTAQWE